MSPAREDFRGSGGNNRGDAGVRNDQVIAGGASTAASSPVDRGSTAAGRAPQSRLAVRRPCLGHSEVDLAAGAPEGEAREGDGRRAADFRVKGRILEDKTLRLRLKIGDASGHTRTVEFPSTRTRTRVLGGERDGRSQLAQSDVRTIMREIENEVKFLNEGRAKAEDGGRRRSSPAPRPRSSAPTSTAAASSDGERAGLIRPSPYRDTASSRSTMRARPAARLAVEAAVDDRRSAVEAGRRCPTPGGELGTPSSAAAAGAAAQPQPQQPPAAIVAPTPVMAYAAPEPPARMPSPSPQQPRVRSGKVSGPLLRRR